MRDDSSAEEQQMDVVKNCSQISNGGNTFLINRFIATAIIIIKNSNNVFSIIRIVLGEDEVEMDILHASESWHMTLDDVIKRIKTKNNNVTNSENFVFLHIEYLSQRFGNQTFEEITKNFIRDYSQTSLDQLVLNRKYEKKKSKLLYNFLSCQLLVYRPKDNNYDYITKLVAEIRK